MAKAKLVEFIVSGNGYFPFDMLRYDCCYPKYEREVHAMGWNPRDGDGRRTLTLRMAHAGSSPTIGRWQSFGWTVDEVKKVNY